MADTRVEIDLDYKGLEQCLEEIGRDFQGEGHGLDRLLERYRSFCKSGIGPTEEMEALVRPAAELTSKGTPLWESTTARLRYCGSACEVKGQLKGLGIKGLYEGISCLTEQGLYGDYIPKHYSREEIEEAEGFLNNERSRLFTYVGLDLLSKQYTIQDHDHRPLEMSQEVCLGTSLCLAMKESKDCRIRWVRRFCNTFSHMQVTMTTPTLPNTRKPYHQLSNRSIDTVSNSPEGIYRSVDNFAQISKSGGGMDLYFGKIRTTGSRIQGFEGTTGGVIRWTKPVNDMAVAVDQLGMCQGAAAVCLDAWHKDLPEPLQLRINNGDDCMKAHGIFPAVCSPDLFRKMAGEDLDQDWHLVYPREVRTIKGYCLEDCYGELWEERYLDCMGDDRISKRTVLLKDVVHLIIKSAVETDTPFTFNRDMINRANPNNHRGIIYCSNLCTEIAQGMSLIGSMSAQVLGVNEEIAVVQTTWPGGSVVCSLAGLYLEAIGVDDPDEVEYIAASAMRISDNIIDLDFYPLAYAGITNQNYRGIGLGVNSYHHMLAKYDIWWESEEHLVLTDQVFERIHYTVVRVSANLAAGKGCYRHFEGSEWQTGAYFEKQGLVSGGRKELAEQVAKHGMRNAYLLIAVPASSTNVLSGITAGLNPVIKRFYPEEKENAVLLRVAPDLTPRTFWLCRSGYTMDQTWTMRAAGARQRHTDQAQSVNLYITSDYTMWQLLNLYILAWESGVKTLYYVHSKSLGMEECESCPN